MKRIIIVAIIATTVFACKKSSDTKMEPPMKYYFKIEAVDTDGTQSTITTYKNITVN